MCSVENEHVAPVYAVHDPLFLLKSYWTALGVSKPSSVILPLFVAHAYVFVFWLTLLFSFSNFSHFLVFTSLMCIYRQLSLPSSPCLLCKEHCAFIDSSCKRGSLVLWSPRHLFQIVFILLYSVHTTRRTNLFQRRSYQHLSSSSETTHPDKPCFVPAFYKQSLAFLIDIVWLKIPLFPLLFHFHFGSETNKQMNKQTFQPRPWFWTIV